MPKHTDPLYVAALERCSRHPVILQMDIGTVFVIASFLQLALRHPTVATAPTASKDIVVEFIRDFQERVRQGEPLIAELIGEGFKG